MFLGKKTTHVGSLKKDRNSLGPFLSKGSLVPWWLGGEKDVTFGFYKMEKD
jgi:hypothetical protein